MPDNVSKRRERSLPSRLSGLVHRLRFRASIDYLGVLVIADREIFPGMLAPTV